MQKSSAVEGRTLTIGAFVRRKIGRRGKGVVINAWPLSNPNGIEVAWQPLGRTNVETMYPEEVEVVG